MLSSIFWNHKYRISATYLLVLVEFTIAAFVPYLLGKALDQALVQDWSFFWIYVGISTLALFLGTGRRMWDTRAFLRIWATVATDAAKQLLDRGVAIPKVISRQALIERYANFYEHILPTFLCGAVDIVVSLTVLWFVVGPVAIWFVGLVFICCLSNYFWSVLSQRQERLQQIHREGVIEAITENVEQVHEQYALVAKRGIRKSDYDAYSWGITDLIIIMAEVVLVFQLVENGASTGAILSTLIYLWKAFCQTCAFSIFFNAYKEIQVTNDFIFHEQ